MAKKRLFLYNMLESAHENNGNYYRNSETENIELGHTQHFNLN